MIKVFSGKNAQIHRDDLTAMFKLRKKVFHDLLKWDVNVEGEIEIDHFDDANPLYVLSYAPNTGRLRGSLRLLPTLGPNMLDDTFPVLLGGEPEIRSAGIWESSRFCIDPELTQDRGNNQVTLAAAELMCAVGEMGIASGLTHIVTVTDVFLERLFRRMGCPGERVGPPQKIGSVYAVAIAWEVGEEILSNMKKMAGFEGSMLEERMPLEVARAA